MAETKKWTREEINARMQTIDVHGNPYIEVDQRILGFWDLFPEGSIETEFLEHTTEYSFCKCTIKNMGVVVATGHADEFRNASKINKTSCTEVCETSAIGRALGILGIGISNGVASAEEVRNAIEQQNADKPWPTEGEFVAKCRTCGTRYTVPSGVTEEQFKAAAFCCEHPDWVVE